MALQTMSSEQHALMALKTPDHRASPPLSIIMSVHNNARFLDPAIASIRKQSFPHFEFLILDDGSTDDTWSVIRRHAAEDARIIAYRKPNQGLVPSLNYLLQRARAPIVARMDGDDVAHPDRLAKQIALLKAHPNIVALGTQISRIDAQGRPLSNQVACPLSHADIMARVSTGLAIAHSSSMFRAEAARRLGGYRQAFKHCEDLDLWLRLSRVGQLANLPDQLMLSRVHADQVSAKHRVEQAMNAAVALAIHESLTAGGRDPLDGCASIPPLDQLAYTTGDSDLPKRVRKKMVASILANPKMTEGAGLAHITQHVAEHDWADLHVTPFLKFIMQLIRGREFRAAFKISWALGQKGWLQ